MVYSDTTKYEILETGFSTIGEQLERLAEAIENGAGGGTCYYPPKRKNNVPGFAPTRIRPSEVPGTDSLTTRALAALQAQEERNLEYQTEALKAILRDKFGVDTRSVIAYTTKEDKWLLRADFDGYSIGMYRNSDGSVGDLYYMPDTPGRDRYVIKDLADLGYHLQREAKESAFEAARQAIFTDKAELGEVGLE